ncbi:MAG: single-stranded DNA-binding protein [Peptococcaceae bacterium]|nr:single-stranded DNA-binding protein [Peptococcaceae bacterium]
MFNRVILIGRLTRDPELRYTTNGIAVATFTLAVNRNFKNAQGERETDFIPCVVFRQLAELCANYLSKGKLAALEGRLQIRSYEAQDGQRKYVTEVIGDDVRFLSPKDSSSNAPSSSSEPSDFGSFAHEVSLDDDIPF